MDQPLSSSTMRNVLLGMVRMQAEWLAKAELAYYRRSLKVRRTRKPADALRADFARLWAIRFAEGLSDDLADLFEVGLSYQGVVLVEAAALKVENGRARLAAAERLAGRFVPNIPTAAGAAAPYIHGGVAR
jgi:hypothetical protein